LNVHCFFLTRPFSVFARLLRRRPCFAPSFPVFYFSLGPPFSVVVKYEKD